VLDLGSGLPTQGHFNEHLPGAQILFVDNDPLSVAQGQQLLAYTPDMAYCEGDLRDPDALVEAAASFLGEDHPTLAVGCIGVAYFLDDDAVRALCRRLHAFCAPGSVLALSFCCVPDLKEAREAVATAVRLSGINFYSRTGEEMAALVAPWRTSPAELLVDLVGGDPSGKLQPGHPMHQSRMLGMFGER
jgi:O-methyltransferase involved in polyketide biosynthesis